MSGDLSAMGPAVLNHLWQSTVFAGAAGLLTMMLKKNQARARYALWLAASAKFLVPFSLLVALGGMLPKVGHTPIAVQPVVYSAMEEVGQPFGESFAAEPTLIPAATVVAPAMRERWKAALPEMVAVAWLCGFVVVFFVWARRWRMVSAAVRRAEPVDAGRELEALRRLEAAMEMRRRIRLMLSRETMEPGVFGLVRPVLVWPCGVSEVLSDEQLNAIVAHEMCHVRCRDNLASAMHMLVEAMFWFHPLVWWMGRRMVEERERACDEEVLRLGSSPAVYAESVLKVCAFCVESPLACVAGITGADLKRRMRMIMTLRLERLSLAKKLVLGAIAVIVVGVPVMFGQMGAAMHGAVSAVVKPVEAVLAPAISTSTEDVLPKKVASTAPETTAEVAAADSNSAAAPDAQLYAKAAGDIQKGEYDTARLALQTLVNTYPQSGFREKAKLAIVESWLEESEATSAEAVKAYKDVIASYPDTAEAEYARQRLAALQTEKSEPQPAFEVASIKRYVDGPEIPFRISDRGQTQIMDFPARVGAIVARTYLPVPNLAQVFNMPVEIDKQVYRIEAKIPDDLFAEMQKMDNDGKQEKINLMMRSLLADRFKLKFHVEMREMPVYELVAKGKELVDSGDSKLKKNAEDDKSPHLVGGRGEGLGLWLLITNNVSMAEFAGNLQGRFIDRPVVDKTGITGRYGFRLEMSTVGTPMEQELANSYVGRPDLAKTDGRVAPSFETVIQDVGLKLVPAKAPVEVIVIDHIELPTEN